MGTSTAVVIRLLDSMRMEGANLGDSGYALFHVDEDDTLQMYFKSPSQQKTHNFPYQCGGDYGDKPSLAQRFLHKDVREGDVIIVFTDGFIDNVYDDEMYECIYDQLDDGLVTSMSGAADCLARKAYVLGKDPNFMSPWMAEFKWYYENNEELKKVGRGLVQSVPPGHKFIGGKADDITITVAQVFTDMGPDDERRQLSENDTYFPE